MRSCSPVYCLSQKQVARLEKDPEAAKIGGDTMKQWFVYDIRVSHQFTRAHRAGGGVRGSISIWGDGEGDRAK